METYTLEPKQYAHTFRRRYLRVFAGPADYTKAIDVATRWTERCFHRVHRDHAVVRTKPVVTAWQEPAFVGWVLRVSIEYAVIPGYPAGTVIYTTYPVDSLRSPKVPPDLYAV